MKKTYTIFKREIKSYFFSPIAYIVLLSFMLLCGVFFFIYLQGFAQTQFDTRAQLFQQTFSLNDFVLQPYFGTISILLLLIIPMITMRLLSEEKKHYTYELLFTSPVRVWSIVVGKYMASLILFIAMLLLSSIFIIVLYIYGNPDLGVIISGYTGLFLLGASFISIGLFASSLTENQVVSAVISFGLLLLFWIIGASAETESSILGYLSIINHLDNYIKGVFELTDFIYYLSFIFFGLFLTHIVLDSERWR